MTSIDTKSIREESELPRYFMRWRDNQPVPEASPVGYWTPWHIAERELDSLRAALAQAERERDEAVCEGLRQAQGISKYIRTRGPLHPIVAATLDDFDVFLAANIERGGRDGTIPLDVIADIDQAPGTTQGDETK